MHLVISLLISDLPVWGAPGLVPLQGMSEAALKSVICAPAAVIEFRPEIVSNFPAPFR